MHKGLLSGSYAREARAQEWAWPAAGQLVPAWQPLAWRRFSHLLLRWPMRLTLCGVLPRKSRRCGFDWGDFFAVSRLTSSWQDYLCCAVLPWRLLIVSFLLLWPFYLAIERSWSHKGHLEAQFPSTFHVAIVARYLLLGLPLKRRKKKRFNKRSNL